MISAWNALAAWRKYQVTACDCADFIARFYKPERSVGRGPACVASLIAACEDDLRADGVTIISHHDSVTGQIVSFYGSEEQELSDETNQ